MQKLLEKQKRLELITTLKQQQTQQTQQTHQSNANANAGKAAPSQAAVRRTMMHDSREARDSNACFDP